MLVPMKNILDAAYAGKYGVPAVPSQNEVQIRASIEAAAETNSPLIFLTYNWGDPVFNHAMIKKLADEVSIPVAVCLDHSRTFDDCVLGVSNGCTAIMADRSEMSFADNAAECALLARVAHGARISIEAELGHVGQGSNYAVDGVSALTDPKEAKAFFDATGVDALAVAVGTAHGVYVGTPKLDFVRLAEIDAACKMPLVLHGGSGSGDANISRACTMGVTKVNVVTDVMIATNQAILSAGLVDKTAYTFFKVVHQATKDFVIHLFEMTGCKGKAGAAVKATAGSAASFVRKE
jgi:fructose-bisphosphate aldolase, class II